MHMICFIININNNFNSWFTKRNFKLRGWEMTPYCWTEYNMYSVALIKIPILFWHDSNEHRQSESKFFWIWIAIQLTYLVTQVGTIVCQ